MCTTLVTPLDPQGMGKTSIMDLKIKTTKDMNQNGGEEGTTHIGIQGNKRMA